jgi:hypothetical protein
LVSVWPHSGQVMSDAGVTLNSGDCTGVSMRAFPESVLMMAGCYKL